MEKSYQQYHTPMGYSIQRNDIVDIPHLLRTDTFYVMGVDGDYVPGQVMQLKRYWQKSEPFKLFLGSTELIYGRDWTFVDSEERAIAWADVTGYSRHMKIIRGTLNGVRSSLVWSAGVYRITASYTSQIDERLGDTPGLLYQLAFDMCVNPYYEFDKLVGKISDPNWKKLNPNRKAYFRNISSINLADYESTDQAMIQALQPGDPLPKTKFEKRVGARFPRPFKLVYPNVVPMLTRVEAKKLNQERLAAGKTELNSINGDYVEIETIYNRINLPSTLTQNGFDEMVSHIGFNTEFNIKSIHTGIEDSEVKTKAEAVVNAIYRLVDTTNMVGDAVLDGKIYELKPEWKTNTNTSTTYAEFDASMSSYAFDNVTPVNIDFISIYTTNPDETPTDDNIHQHMLLNLEKIRDMFIVEADVGADVYTGDDKTDQSWRIMFKYNTENAELNVNIATKYQIPDTGVISLTERTSSTFKTEIAREPGELADVYLSINSTGFTDKLPVDPTTGLPAKQEISTTQRSGGFVVEQHYDKLSDHEAVFSPNFNIRARHIVKLDGRTNIIDNKGNRVNWFPYLSGGMLAGVNLTDNAAMSGIGGYPNYEKYRQHLSEVPIRATAVGTYDQDCDFSATLKPMASASVDNSIKLDGYLKYDDVDINKGSIYGSATGSLRECRFVLNPNYIGGTTANDFNNRKWISVYADNLLSYLPKVSSVVVDDYEMGSISEVNRTGGGYDAAVTYTSSPSIGDDYVNPGLILSDEQSFRIYLKPHTWWDNANPYFASIDTDDVDQESQAFATSISKDRLKEQFDIVRTPKANKTIGALNTFDFTDNVFDVRLKQIPTIQLPTTNTGVPTITSNSTPINEVYSLRDYDNTDPTSYELGDWLTCSKDVGIRFYTWYTSDLSAPNNYETFKRHLEIYLEYKRYSAKSIVRDIIAAKDELQQLKQVWVDIAYKEYETSIVSPVDEIAEQKESTRLELVKKKSCFFNRKGQYDKDIVNTYPLSYKLTVTGYGVGFHVWDQASLDADTEYAWFIAQRHVDNTSAKPYLLQKAPLHCVYSPAKRRDTLDELPLYFKAGDVLGVNDQITKLYDATGKQMSQDEQVIVPIVFDETNVTNLIRLPEEGLTTYNKQFVKDSISVMMGDSQVAFDSQAVIVQRIDRKRPAYDQGAVKWTNRLTEAMDGSLTYSIDTASGQNAFVYDETNHMVYLKYMPPVGSKLYVSYRIKPLSTNFGDQYTIQKKEDPEFPERDMNKTKAIYRFVVRERDVLKPWDFHKSATMHQVDSFAIINPLEQLSVTPDRNFVFAVPNGLTTQRFYYPTSEVDLIAYTSAEISAQGSMIEISKYSDDFYYDSSVTATKIKDPATGDYKPVKEDGSAVPYETAPTRVYEGMMATLPNGNGMRLFFLSNGGPIRPEWSDVDPADV